MTDRERFTRWLKVGLINLTIVALYGSLMRYKIAYDFPYFKQTNLLHAHHYFAFTGWISHIVYSGLALILNPFLLGSEKRKYDILIFANLVCAYGMLFSFTIYGYSVLSSVFSVSSILVTLFFTYFYVKDAYHFPKNNPSKPWAIMGLFLNIISCGGPIYIGYMMLTQHIEHDKYLAYLYYFLHFQYNGWFFFGTMAILASILPRNFINLKNYFWVFALAIIPTVVLSLIWLKVPLWLYWLAVIATYAELVTWIYLVFKLSVLLKRKVAPNYPTWVNLFLYGAVAAVTIKFVLQAVSVIPSLSNLVFGYRPIIIAYLHLVMLGIYTLFILGFGFQQGYLKITTFSKYAALGFMLGVILNESFLAVQGFFALGYKTVPHINLLLLIAAIVLLISSVFLSISQKFSKLEIRIDS